MHHPNWTPEKREESVGLLGVGGGGGIRAPSHSPDLRRRRRPAGGRARGGGGGGGYLAAAALACAAVLYLGAGTGRDMALPAAPKDRSPGSAAPPPPVPAQAQAQAQAPSVRGAWGGGGRDRNDPEGMSEDEAKPRGEESFDERPASDPLWPSPPPSGAAGSSSYDGVGDGDVGDDGIVDDHEGGRSDSGASWDEGKGDAAGGDAKDATDGVDGSTEEDGDHNKDDNAQEEEEEEDWIDDNDTDDDAFDPVEPATNSDSPRSAYRIPPVIRAEFRKWSNELQNLTDMAVYDGSVPDVHWEWHEAERADRFPGIEERVEYYMGRWYNATAPSMYGPAFDGGSYVAARTTRAFGVMSSFAVDLFNLTRDGLLRCDREETASVLHAYCRDYVDLAILHGGSTAHVVMHLGDSIPTLPHKDSLAITDYPVFNKVRHFCEPRYREQVRADLNPTCSADGGGKGGERRVDTIVWPMNRKRHLSPAASVALEDIPWSEKVGRAIWRGGSNDAFGHSTKTELVHRYVGSDLVDAKFAKRSNKRGRGVNKDIAEDYMGDFISKEEQLKHKYLISIEGNDVSSGLKWMLFSNSLVLLPPTTYESWAMEGMLKPYEHYIPIKADASDVEEQVQWAEDHPEEAQKISERSTLFMYDLLFHPDAVPDEQAILERIMERYEENFGYAATVSVRHPLSHIHGDWHPKTREERFPTINERVSLYLGRWSTEIMNMARTEEKNPLYSQLSTNTKPKLDAEFVVSGKDLARCAEDDGGYSNELRRQCKEALPFFDDRITYDLKGDRHPKNEAAYKLAPESKRAGKSQNRWFKRILIDDTIKILKLGDQAPGISDYPVFAKSRKVGEGESATILWPFGETDDYVESGRVEALDVAFEDKMPKAIWRGDFGVAHPLETGVEMTRRLDLVERAQGEASDLIDAKFIFSRKDRELDRQREHPLRPKEFMYEPTGVNGTDAFLQGYLGHRYIIATEDDYRIDLNLKWMFLSRSVVLMPADRRFVSWFMESELKEYVHFVPILPDYSDVEKQIAWCEQHLAKAERIAERATLFVHDSLFHVDALTDSSKVEFRIMERYTNFFNGTAHTSR